MAFIAGTEVFRHISQKVKPYFTKGTLFAGGQGFPFQRGIMAKDLDKAVKDEHARAFFYAVGDDDAI